MAKNIEKVIQKMGDVNNDSFDDIFNDSLTRHSMLTTNWANQASVVGQAQLKQIAPSASQMQQKYNTVRSSGIGDAMMYDIDRTQRQAIKSPYKAADAYKPASFHSRLTNSSVF